jgi:threonine synthase
MLQMVCTGCDHTEPVDVRVYDCPWCGAPFRFVDGMPNADTSFPNSIDPHEQGVWRYRRLLPVEEQTDPVTLGEGGTPVVRLDRWGAEHGLPELRAKLEHLGPTGSFKDRGTTLLLTALRAAGVERVIEDSSGNAGAAVAAYAARAGIAARVFVPASAPAGKLAQIAAYGAEIVPVEGTREEVTEAALAALDADTVYASHNLSPYFPESLKTFAYELYEFSADDLPDHIVFPVGNGSLLLGAARGFADLAELSAPARSPRLHAAQAENCAPIVYAHNHRVMEDAPEWSATLAGGVAVAQPPRMAEILEALHDSGGTATTVSEAEIREAAMSLARMEGLYVEPTTAVAFAAAARLRREGAIGEGQKVLVPVTGSGLKDPLING